MTERGAQIMRDGIAERFELLVGRLEFGGARLHLTLQVLVELTDLLIRAFSLNCVKDRSRKNTAAKFHFGDVVLRALLDHFQRQGLIAQACKHYNRHRGGLGLRPVKRLPSLAVWKREVEENRVDASRIQAPESCQKPVNELHVEWIALRLGQRLLN